MNNFLIQTPWLKWVLLPVTGAIIGYVTNYIAIKMLFNPYKAWYLLGIRVPFTPGIIPRHRGDLAKNIGNMIETVLLDESILKKHLFSAFTHELLDKVIQKNISVLLDYDIPAIHAMVPQSFQNDFYYLCQQIKKKMNAGIISLVEGKGTKETIERMVATVAAQMYTKNAGELVKIENTANRVAVLLEKLAEKISSEALLESIISKKLDSLKHESLPLNRIIPADVLPPLISWLQKEYPTLIEKIQETLFDSKIEKKLVISLKNSITQYLSNLNTFERLLTNLWGVEQRLDEELPEVIHSALLSGFKTLKTQQMDERIEQKISSSITVFLNKPLGELLSTLKQESIESLQHAFSTRLYAILKDEVRIKKLSTTIVKLWESESQTQTGALFEIAGIHTNILTELLSEFLLTFLQETKTRQNILDACEKLFDEWVFQKHIGPVCNVFAIEDAHKKRLSDFLALQILTVVEKDVPFVIKSINLKKLVEDRINLFPIQEVEELVLVMIKKHLKWISVFGGGLGFIIGAMQLLVR